MNQWLEQNKVVVLTVIGLLIAGGVGALALRWQTPAPITIQPPPPTQTPAPIRIYVSGAVLHPDVYNLSADSIVRDALAAAGGASGDADLNHVNLAQPLKDGQQVYVPRIGELPTGMPLAAGTAQLQGPININTATTVELDSLPHIGPALADRIVKYREAHGPFARIEDLQRVAGIGPSVFSDIKDLITVK